MVKLRAARAFNYAGRDLAAGEEFEATEGDAMVLTRAAPPLAKAASDSAAAQPSATAEPPLLAAEEQETRRSRYNRRDMRAKT